MRQKDDGRFLVGRVLLIIALAIFLIGFAQTSMCMGLTCNGTFGMTLGILPTVLELGASAALGTSGLALILYARVKSGSEVIKPRSKEKHKDLSA